MRITTDQLFSSTADGGFRLETDTYAITNRPDVAELRSGHALRAKVFCKELRWVGNASDQYETDRFDPLSTSIVISVAGHTIGYLRVSPRHAPWMATETFKSLIPRNFNLRRWAQADISRLAVAADYRRASTGAGNIAALLYQGLYLHCRLADVARLSMVVSRLVYRNLRQSGIPCQVLTDAASNDFRNAPSLALLDWGTFSPPEHWCWGLLPQLPAFGRNSSYRTDFRQSA